MSKASKRSRRPCDAFLPRHPSRCVLRTAGGPDFQSTAAITPLDLQGHIYATPTPVLACWVEVGGVIRGASDFF